METDLIALAAQSPVALWLIAVGIFSPLAISVIQQSRFSPRLQSIIAFVFYIAVAAVTVGLNGIFSTATLFVAILVVFITGSAAYKNLWKPTGVAPAIEAKTPIGSTGPLG
jgi:uncharacterized membrane protein YfhO